MMACGSGPYRTINVASVFSVFGTIAVNLRFCAPVASKVMLRHDKKCKYFAIKNRHVLDNIKSFHTRF